MFVLIIRKRQYKQHKMEYIMFMFFVSIAEAFNCDTTPVNKRLHRHGKSLGQNVDKLMLNPGLQRRTCFKSILFKYWNLTLGMNGPFCRERRGALSRFYGSPNSKGGIPRMWKSTINSKQESNVHHYNRSYYIVLHSYNVMCWLVIFFFLNLCILQQLTLFTCGNKWLW